MDSCSYRRATALIESKCVPELAATSREELKEFGRLSKEASDVIKQIELCILDLKRGSRYSPPSGNTVVPLHSEAPNKLPDTVTDLVPKVESAPVILAKSPVVTGSKPGQTALCARCRNYLLSEVRNGRCVEPTGSRTEMELQDLIAIQPVYLLPATKIMASPVSSRTIGRGTGIAADYYVPTTAGNISERIKVQNQMTDIVFSKNIDSTVTKTQLLNETSSGNRLTSTQTDKCDSSRTDGDKISRIVPSSATCLQQQIDEGNLNQNQMGLEDYIFKPSRRQLPKLPRVSNGHTNHKDIQRFDSGHETDGTWESWREKMLPLRTSKKHHLLDHKPEDFPASFTSNSKQMDKVQVGDRKTADPKHPSRKIQHQDESEDASVGSNSSDSRSQQASMSNSESEEYYLPGDVQKLDYVSPTSSGETDIYSYPRRQRYYASDSNSDITYSWSSSDGSYPVTPSSSDDRLKNSCPSSFSSDHVFRISSAGSEDEHYSVYNQQRVQHQRPPRYLSVGSSSKKFSAARVYKSDKEMTAKKRRGKWKKLKDKLSVIFHHHHHHHNNHHHHNHSSNDESRMARGSFRFKNNLKKTAHPMRTEVYGEKAHEKLDKSVVHSRDRRHQHNHFNALVGGLFNHIRHSKPPAKHNKQIGKGFKEGRKASAKLHWWQLLQHHRRVKKLGLRN